MKIVRFLGGLGNQMFQYAFYLSLSQKFGKVKADLKHFKDYPLHNGFELERIFNIKLKRASKFQSKLYANEGSGFMFRKLRRVMGAKNAYYTEKRHFGYEPGIFHDQKSRYYWGYWQNLKYVSAVEKQLRKDFSFQVPLDEINSDLLNKIRFCKTVALHVRRGDYLSDPFLGGICDLEYYRQAIEIAKRRVQDPRFIVFSNDIAWCKASLDLEDAIYVDWNLGLNSYKDMQLMSKCHNNIISNSSFSWWGAWLNNNKEAIIIAPKRWMNLKELDYSGLIPENWITI
jgi:hypothetical protein